MAIVREWITVTPESKDAAQAAIDLAELGGEVSADSWTPYPSVANAKLCWVGWQGDDSVGAQIVQALGGVVDTRHRRGQTKPSAPAMTAAEALALFPLPNSGPPVLTVVTKKAALSLHYRDFDLGPFDNDGSPGAQSER